MTDPSSPLTPSELADLKVKAKAATPGPWEADGQGNRMDGGYGPYEDAAVLFRRNGHMTTGVLVETSNADHLLTPEERRVNCEHIAAANPETILRLIDMVERRDAWQPIETAPRGEHLLLVYDGGAVSNSAGIRLWRSRGSDLNQFIRAGITHWQPLPAPPSEALAATEPQT